MGLFDWLFGKRKPVEQAASPFGIAPKPVVPATSLNNRQAGRPVFAILDVETTGLSPKHDRVIEIAVVRMDGEGRIVDEWTTRFNPEGPVGATHIHGITDADVRDSPLFRAVAADLVPYIAGLPLVAHNARFDLAFLRNELSRAGWDVPWLPAYCTLDGSRHYLPELDRRRLVDCCWATGVSLENAHSALGDARATAELLRAYLYGIRHRPVHAALFDVRSQAAEVQWPKGPARAYSPVVIDSREAAISQRIRYSNSRPKSPALLSQLTSLRLEEIVDEGAPIGTLTYVEALLGALEDGELSGQEQEALTELTSLYELADTDIAAAHRAVLLALAHRAMDDGLVSRAERQELKSVASVLAVPERAVKTIIDEADAARAERLSAGLQDLPVDWMLGEPLRVGDKVAFTGCDAVQREALEIRSTQLGVRVTGNVSGLTALLVTDGSFSGTKLDDAERLGTRTVGPDEYAVLLMHLQPARVRGAVAAGWAPPSIPDHGGVAASTESNEAAGRTNVSATANPSAIRDWALTNGYEVGVRGRLPAEVVEAFALASA